MIVTQIVPKLPPAINGLGDYALNLARQLRQDLGIETQFIIGDSIWKGPRQIEDFPIHQIENHSIKALTDLLQEVSADKVLLHYGSYAYAKRGCPIWLVNGLKQWHTLIGGKRLVTMFHEIYAYSYKPWTSSFWLALLQKKLAIQLVRTSDSCFTSLQEFAALLSEFDVQGAKRVIALPVFSNIGEPSEILPLSARTRRLVIFGHRNSKLQIYQQYLGAITHICQMLAINEICDIGVPTGLNLCKSTNLPVKEMGVMKAEVISQVLQDSVAGLISFPPVNQLAKSGIFAAYCAHGMISFAASAQSLPIDGLENNRHYFIPGADSTHITLDTAQIVANHALSWYQAHALPHQTKVFAQHLLGTVH